jgi:hypothetical protein
MADRTIDVPLLGAEVAYGEPANDPKADPLYGSPEYLLVKSQEEVE